MSTIRWTTGALAGVASAVILSAGFAGARRRRRHKLMHRFVERPERWLEHRRDALEHQRARLEKRLDALENRLDAGKRAGVEAVQRLAPARYRRKLGLPSYRDRLEQAGSEAVQRTRRVLTSAAAGAAYGKLRPHLLRRLPWLPAGTLFGAALHAFDLDGKGRLLDALRGRHGLEELRDSRHMRVVAKRLALYLLFGAVTAFAFELFAARRRY